MAPEARGGAIPRLCAASPTPVRMILSIDPVR